MKKLRPNRTLYTAFGFSALLIFLVGAAFWHTLLDGNSLDCAWKGTICLFIPDLSDWYIHLISYALMLPLMLAFYVWFANWRKQWMNLNLLTRNLSTLEIKDSKLEEVVRNLGLVDKVRLLDSADLLCFCACFTSPRIYVSRGVVELLADTELEALLLHEKYHLKSRDPLKILLGRLTVSGLFYMPILKDLFQRYLIRMEIAADQSALRYQGHRRGLVGALQKLLQKRNFADASGFAVSGTEALKYRVNYMAGRPEEEKICLSHIFLSFLAPVLVLTAVIASLTILHI